MGGGGGSAFPVGRGDIEKLRERAHQLANQASLDAEVNELLDQELKAINARNTVQVQERLEVIVDALASEIEDVERTLFGGSVAKRTYVEGLSDIDALVELGGDTERESPQEVRVRFAQILRERLPEALSVSEGRLAVTVGYQDGMDIQLLPALNGEAGLAISSQDGGSWAAIHPRTFARELSSANSALGGALVPSIKLAKQVIAAQVSENTRPSGYHVEALAISAFQDYVGSKGRKAMLTHFFATAANKVLQPIHDVSKQSKHIDASLGGANSSARADLSRQLQAVGERMENARQASDWQALLAND